MQTDQLSVLFLTAVQGFNEQIVLFLSTEVSFNHRSVFPALFNSTVIDYWWRRPLTFRVYFRESGKRMVHCYLEWLRICRIATISFKIVETLNSSRVTSENKTIHTPPPPLLERLGCSTGSLNRSTTLHGGRGSWERKSFIFPF